MLDIYVFSINKVRFAIVLLVCVESFVDRVPGVHGLPPERHGPPPEGNGPPPVGHGFGIGGPPPKVSPPKCPPLPPGFVQIHTWSIYFIGVLLILMFFVIIYLIYALTKAKGHQYNVMNDMSQTAFAPSNQVTFNRQDSEVPICKANSTVVTPVEEIVVDNFCFHNSESISGTKCEDDNIGMLQRNGVSTSTINKYESKVLPIIKKSVQSHLMLPPEQMREICKGVLQNRKSIKDLDELADSFERRPSKGSKRGLAREKSASTPELDLIYDMLPAPEPVNITDDNKDNKDTNINTEQSVSEEKETENTKTKDTTDSDIDIDNLDDIYDSPPVPSSTKKIIYNDTEYLIVIDPELELSEGGPSYINAKKNEFML